jgi:UDP-N-acetyl-D-mannosaminuronic acid dehydrogenase
MKKICILGQGYIGLPTALMFANHGLKVVGVDTKQDVIHTLSSGGLHIEEPGLKEYFALALKSGNLSFSLAVEDADAFIITVPTPFFHDDLGEYQGQSYKKADMRFVVSAAEMILPHLKPGNLVILESTSPPRTTVELLAPILERSGLRAGVDFSLVYCPERVLPGQILKELVENARVVGGITPASALAGRDLYSSFVTGEIHLTDATTAEMVKVMENTYRDVNIAIANEFSRLADRFGVDVWEAISLANRHPRVKILNPGPGVGGHCISVDPWFFVESAPDLASLIYSARKVNDAQPQFVVELAQRMLGDLHGKRIAALGLSYKPDVDDFRESPAIEVVEKLQALGSEVCAYDPFAKALVAPGLHLSPNLSEAVNGADLIILLVDHAQFKTLTPQACQGMHSKKILDTRHCLDAAIWSQSGFELALLGGKV